MEGFLYWHTSPSSQNDLGLKWRNIRKPDSKGEIINISPNGFIHEKVPLKLKLDCCRGEVMPWTLSSFHAYSTTLTVFLCFPLAVWVLGVEKCFVSYIFDNKLMVSWWECCRMGNKINIIPFQPVLVDYSHSAVFFRFDVAVSTLKTYKFLYFCLFFAKYSGK